ncbi:phosphatidate cytidylyltransferase [Cellulosilyticum ruminicola]|uniref:phosphatidate cytidylyltransferase n=1 Tax=Cellulosilyticum ruminicola TaxID=425254 RepID=UPI0006D1C888|nr:phosphatidate cytidylyltransferase [Cellulosilyticum ruminicola]
MGTRILTAVIGLPIVVGLILLGNPILQLTMLGISLIGIFEFYRVVEETHKPMKYIGYGATIIYFLGLDLIQNYFDIFLSLLVLATLLIMIICYPKYEIVDVALTIMGVLYIPILFAFIVLIRKTQYGNFWIWLIFLSSWGSDTFAYFTGRALGKHKLAPVLSPKKTIEGSIGGMIGAGVLGFIYTIIYTHYRYNILVDYMALVVSAVVIAALISQFGDLAASAIKRKYSKKDFGNLLPGHGGILDRFDSILFVAPMIYLAVEVAEKIIG